MGKPKAIQWLEQETGETIPYVPERPGLQGRERHLSVRVEPTLAIALDELAAERGVTVSQLVRELLGPSGDRTAEHGGLDVEALVDRLAAEVAEVRRRLAR